MTVPVNDPETSSPGAIGALILIPVIIAGAAAVVAIKASGYFDFISHSWNSVFSYRHKRKKSNPSDERSPSPEYPDSLGDLESVYPVSVKGPLEDSASKSSPSPSKTWHPARSSRLEWSFGPQTHNPYELSRVLQRPLPSVAPPGTSNYVFLPIFDQD
jgi:hypothetical protein